MADSEPSRVRLGDFTIEKKIGEGGMGTVYLARQESLDRAVALKVLPRNFAENPEFVERFRREARAAASLIHNNVVQVYSVGQERGVAYFAMEYVDGASLDALLSGGRCFEVREAVEIAASVARALAAANEKDLVHRDIKPANVMLDSKGTVKVTDFGLAKPTTGASDITQPGLVIGTPTYMSPEQGAGEDVDGRSDIYSLGLVLYEILTGVVPFCSDNVGTLIYKHLHEPPRPPSEVNPAIPRPIEAIVLKCLAKHPEDRYANADELLRELEAFLKGTSQTLINAAAAVAAGGLPVGAEAMLKTTPMPTPATPVPPPATFEPAAPTIRRPKSKRWIGLLAAALLASAGGGGYYYYHYVLHPAGAGNGNGPDGGPGPDVAGPDSGPDGGVTPKLFTLPLSRLRGLVPAGSRVELVTAEETVLIDPAAPQDLELGEGSYPLKISRRGYRDLGVNLALSEKGVNPRIDAKLVALEPAAELAEPYAAAEGLLSAEKIRPADAAKALAQLKMVADIDPDFRKTSGLRERAGKILAEARRRWAEEFDGAKDLATARDWAGAKTAFEKLLAEMPPEDNLYNSVQIQITTAAGNLEKQVRYRGEMKRGIKSADFESAELAYRQLAMVAPGTDEFKKLGTTLKTAGRLWTEASGAYDGERYEEAGEKLDELLTIAPECTTARERLVECGKLGSITDRLERQVTKARGLLAAKDYAACLKTLDSLAGEDLGKLAGEVKTMRAAAEEGSEKTGVTAQLARLDAALAGGDIAAIKKDVLDFRPAANDFVIGFESRTRELLDSGLEISAWEHQVEDVTIERSADGVARSARVQATCRFELGAPRLEKKLTGSVPVALGFNRVEGRWLLASVAAAGQAEARPTGAAPAAPGQVTGKVAAIRGDIITIDRGRDHGVADGMVFDIYEESRVVRLPLSKETVFVEERPAASVEAVRVGAKSSQCAFLPGTDPEAAKKVKAGMLAASSRVKKVRREFPVLLELKSSAPAAAAGRKLKMSLDLKPVEGVFVSYRWSADGGLLGSARTAAPKATWTAPAAAGDYKITVTCIAPSGRKEARSVTVKSTGTAAKPPAAYALVDRLGAPGLLDECRDIAFDEAGRAYVLDGRKRRVVILDPEFRVQSVSASYAGALDFSRIAARGGVLYCLDGRSGSVKRYSLAGGENFFAKEAGKAIGGKGTGNGRMRSPVDLEVAPSGEVYVLDAESGAPSVQVFGAKGEYLQSFGSAAAGPGALDSPVALTLDAAGAVHVLDAGRRGVISFKNGRPAGSFACAAKDAKLVKLVDLTYDPATDSLLVLEAGSGQATVWSPGGARRGNLTLGLKRPGPGHPEDPTRMAAGPAASALIAGGEGQLLDRFATDGTFLGRLGGEPLSESCKIAAGPDGGFFALDTRAALVRGFDRDGWLVSEFGGRKTFPRAVDLVVDQSGQVYVLDSSQYTVKVFDAQGRPAGAYGRRGRPPEGLDDPIDLATDGAGLLAVLCYQAQNSIFHYALGEQKRPAVFPAEKGATPKPQALAVDAEGRTFLLGKSGQVDVWSRAGTRQGSWPISFRQATDIVASAGRVFVLDSREKKLFVCDPGGKELARIALPANASQANDLAASDYETVYVYDAATKSVLKYRPSE